jgi:hypothetical protein
MSTPQLEEKLFNLQQKIGYSEKGDTLVRGTNVLSLKASTKEYIILFLVVGIILIVFRPPIIYEQDDGGETKLSYKKLAMYWLIISAMLSVVYFVYNFKKQVD